MDERELEVFRFTDDPDVSACIESQCAGTEIASGHETRIDQPGTRGVKFGEPSAGDELWNCGDSRIGCYGVGRIWT